MNEINEMNWYVRISHLDLFQVWKEKESMIGNDSFLLVSFFHGKSEAGQELS